MTFYSERTVTTRKAYKCDTCGAAIDQGDKAVRGAGLSDGEFYSLVLHPDCRQAEIDFNKLYNTYDSDAWQNLFEALNETEAQDWLREKFPAVASRILDAALAASAPAPDAKENGS